MSLLFIKCYSRAPHNDQHACSSKTCFDRKFSLKNIQTKHFGRLSGRTRKHVEEDTKSTKYFCFIVSSLDKNIFVIIQILLKFTIKESRKDKSIIFLDTISSKGRYIQLTASGIWWKYVFLLNYSYV